MVSLRPFHPVYFTKNHEATVAPPFDSIPANMETVLKENEFNITHLTLPEKNCLLDGNKTIYQWLQDGVIRKMDEEVVIVVKQSFTLDGKKLCRTGMISLVDIFPDDGCIKPHERTFPSKVEERKKVLDSIETQLEPIFFVADNDHLEDALTKITDTREPSFRFLDVENVHNSVYFVKGVESRELVELMNTDTVLVADGHHRLEASKMLAKNSAGEIRKFWSSIMAYITSVNSEGLKVRGIHRVIKKTINLDNFLESINERMQILGTSATSDSELIEIYYKGRLFTINLKPPPDSNQTFSTYLSPVHMLNQLIFKEILGFSESDIEGAIEYIHSVEEAKRQVDSGEGQIAFLMPSWNKNELFKLVLEEGFLPQKSTYFYPKVCSGIAMNTLINNTNVPETFST